MKRNRIFTAFMMMCCLMVSARLAQAEVTVSTESATSASASTESVIITSSVIETTALGFLSDAKTKLVVIKFFSDDPDYKKDSDAMITQDKALQDDYIKNKEVAFKAFNEDGLVQDLTGGKPTWYEWAEGEFAAADYPVYLFFGKRREATKEKPLTKEDLVRIEKENVVPFSGYKDDFYKAEGECRIKSALEQVSAVINQGG